MAEPPSADAALLDVVAGNGAAHPARNAELESLATGVELTLASVLQGIALALLIPKAVELLTSGEYAKLPYIPASLLLIFIVWVAFIGHALSVIAWPFDPLHNFLYFLVTGSEAVLLVVIEQPAQWFLALVGFAVVMGFNTWYNQRRLTQQRRRYATAGEQALYAHIVAEQRAEMSFMAGYFVLGILGFIGLKLRPEFGLPQELGWVVTGFGAMVLPLVHVLRQGIALRERTRLIELAKGGT